jgi:hypothetical protein
MAESTWHERELPLLEAVRAAEESGEDIERAARAALPDLDQAIYLRTVQALIDDGKLEGKVLPSAAGPIRALIRGLAPEGRRMVGQWPSPSDPFEGLLRAIDEQLHDSSTDAETRSALQRLRSTVVDIGKGALSGLLAAYLRGALPVP